MPDQQTRAHPYMACSTDEAKNLMLETIGVAAVDDLFEQVPEDHRLKAHPKLPPAIPSEVALRRHLLSFVNENQHAEEYLNFLGAGTWQHHVPAIVDEVWTRSEFLTSVWGTPSSDLGRNQAWFEFASQLGELVGMDFVGLPVYSWGAAMGYAFRMAGRLTGRRKILVSRLSDPERMAVAKTYAGISELNWHVELVEVGVDMATGRLDMDELEANLGDDVAGVYVENPTYLGIIEDGIHEIAARTRAAGAETIVGVDPVSLGIVAAPGDYGADIVIGSTQPLGIHMNGGGGTGGFIATRDEERYAREYPTLQVSITDTIEPGERAFALILFEQSSYGSREEGNDWTGNSVYLWTVANAVYMSAMGPAGFRELGRTVIEQSHYAAARLDELDGVSIKWPTGFFKEFVVDFADSGRTVREINSALLEREIFGGKDLSADLPGLGQSALYCVTEVHTQRDIDRLVDAIAEVTT